jgi:hypothetical protein
MKEKIKIIFENVQMRNIIYLFLGLIFSIIIIATYKPYKKNLEIVPEDEVKVPQKEIEKKSKTLNEILEDYKKIEMFSYKIYYKEYIINGIYENGIFMDDSESEEIKTFEELIRPNNLYNILKDKNYQNNYEYNIDNYTIKLEIENDKIQKVTINQIIMEYGG